MNIQKKLAPILTTEHWESIIKERKMDFYESAMHFLAKNDILEVVQTLEKITVANQEQQERIENTTSAIKDIWHKHHCHIQDIEEIKHKQSKI